MRTLVLGLGNELYGDDGVGLHVIRRLKQEFAESRKDCEGFEDIDFVECSLSGLALLDLVVGYDSLVIVDTIKRNSPVAGKIHVLEAENLRAIPGPSPHYVSIPQTLEIGKKIGLKVPSRIKIIAVEAKNIYHLGEGLTEETAKCIPIIVEKVKEILKLNRSRTLQGA
jgi:hydrogenase maturation protease